MEIVHHCGVDVVHLFKIGPMDKQYYYIFDIKHKACVQEVYRPAPRFLFRDVARLRFFRDPYTGFSEQIWKGDPQEETHFLYLPEDDPANNLLF